MSYKEQGRRPITEAGFRSETKGDASRDLLARLEGHLAAIHDSASFRAYLTMQARFHAYSWGNTLLIAAQAPDATRVAGYRAWQKLGRQVRKGERGIRIIVPMPTTVENDAGEPETRLRFGVGHVFDLAQTDGEPLPTLDVPVLDGDDGGILYDQLAYLAHDEGIRIDRRKVLEPTSAQGSYNPRTKRLFLREGPQLQLTQTLAHELAHHFIGLHESYGELRAEHETVAESVAFVVCARFGLDTAAASLPYIAGWSEHRDRFRSVLGTIQGVSAQIIDRVGARLGGAAAPASSAEQPPAPPPAHAG